jgi:hypothetical protein
LGIREATMSEWLELIEYLFIFAVIGTVLSGAVLILDRLGIFLLRIRDRETNKKRLIVCRRVM